MKILRKIETFSVVEARRKIKKSLEVYRRSEKSQSASKPIFSDITTVRADTDYGTRTRKGKKKRTKNVPSNKYHPSKGEKYRDDIISTLKEEGFIKEVKAKGKRSHYNQNQAAHNFRYQTNRDLVSKTRELQTRIEQPVIQ